jgi:hypothetical protein
LRRKKNSTATSYELRKKREAFSALFSAFQRENQKKKRPPDGDKPSVGRLKEKH